METIMDKTATREIVQQMRLIYRDGSPIVRDIDLACFILDGLLIHTVDDVRKACLVKFGPEKTPSRSAIYRFWMRFRSIVKSPSK